MPFQKGNTIGKRPGRPKGNTAEIVKEAFSLVLMGIAPRFKEWIEEVAKKDKEKALRLAIELSERFVPRMKHTEIEISPETIKAINYIKPNGRDNANADSQAGSGVDKTNG